MHILPVSKTDNRKFAFRSKYKPLKMFSYINNMGNQLDTILPNKGALALLAGVSFLAGSFVTAILMLASKSKTKFNEQNVANIEEAKQEKQIVNINYDKLFEEKPERNKYLAITSCFPNLDKEYQSLLTKTLAEPENDKNKRTVEALETIFKILSKDDGLKYRKSYFEVLDKNSDCLDGVSKNLDAVLSNDDSIMHYLVLLNNEKITKQDIKKWAQYTRLSCDEFMILKDFDDNILKSINELKSTNKNFKIKYFDEMLNAKYCTNYTFKLSFSENLSLEDKLKTIRDVHKAIYGDIYVNGEKQQDKYYLQGDIKTELLDSIVKDNQLDSVFNFVKYLNPKSVKFFKLTSNKVKFLDKGTDLYKQIQSICMNELVNIDFNSQKLVEMTELMGNDDIWGGLIGTIHARMRFITRFVLKDNYNADLTKNCKEKLKILRKELENELDKCNYFCFSNHKGTAPQFYIKGSRLGDYVKITLNNKGEIHTIYEDFRKINKQ